MKSAYCIAIMACLTIIWLREKKSGDGGKLCWKALAGRTSDYALCDSLPFLIRRFMASWKSWQWICDSRTFYIFCPGKTEARESAWECLYLYIWNPIPVLSVLSRGKKRMLLSGWRY